ncbi:hypothetical protein GYM34_004989 [Escherichia coli]|nr:hypothetical protein [Escherichia coli]EFI3996432.1 hypothetical protein [Escherichia coli]
MCGDCSGSAIAFVRLCKCFWLNKSMTLPVLILWITVIKELLLMICSCSLPDEFWS